VRYSDLGDLKPIEENVDEPHSSDMTGEHTPERPDSPILHGDGLSGIRSHLRNPSDMSSIYPPPSPGLPAQDPLANRLAIEEPLLEQSRSPSVASYPHEDDIIASAEQPEASSRGSEDSSDSTPFPGDSSDPNVASWKEELYQHHRRDGSTETQKEREEFALELAERRRKVQEKLRSVAESESRSSSPTPGRSTPDIKAGNAFSILKYKSSKQELPGNAHIYGYGNSSTPALPSDDLRREEERATFSFGRHGNSSSPQIAERSFRSRMPTLSRASRDVSQDSSRSRNESPGQRERSGSGGSGRSKSRTRYRDRDDLETVEEGAVIAHDNFVIPDNFEPPVPGSVAGSARPSMDNEPGYFDRAASAASGRYRSTSRSGTPSFQYERPFQYQQSQPASMIGVSPRPSPATPAYSANATPPLNEDQSPSVSVGGGANQPQRPPGQHMLQKRPINKKLISEPTFVSCTSNVPTVGLPGGSPAGTPPVPPMNPRRRRGTQTFINAFKSDSSRVSSPAPSISDERSVFPDDEKTRPRSNSRSRSRLRKTSSEGGSMHVRARQEALAGHVPAVPSYPPPAIPADGGMF
jgi:hypothetical protein